MLSLCYLSSGLALLRGPLGSISLPASSMRRQPPVGCFCTVGSAGFAGVAGCGGVSGSEGELIGITDGPRVPLGSLMAGRRRIVGRSLLSDDWDCDCDSVGQPPDGVREVWVASVEVY